MSTGLSVEFCGVDLADSGPNVSNITQLHGNDNNQNDSRQQFNRQTSLKEFFEQFGEIDQEIKNRETTQDITDYLRRVQCNIKGTRIIHDVVPNVSRDQCTYFFKRCMAKKFHGGIFMWAFHIDHVHVIHDCSYSGDKCRCTRIQCLPTKRNIRKHYRMHYWSDRYFYLLTKYLLTTPRQLLYFEVSGRSRTVPNQIRDLSYQRYCSIREEPMVESGSDEDEFSNQFSCRSDAHPSRKSGPSGSSTNFKNKRYKKRGQEEKLLDFFQQFPSSPILNVLNSNCWIQSEFKFLRKSDSIIGTVADIFNLQLCTKSVSEIYLFSNASNPLYAAVTGNINEYYYSLEESTDIAIKLLHFQFNDDEDTIKIFLSDLLNILDKKLPKVNTLQVIAPPSSGKNFFFDMVIHYFFNFGQIGNFNKYCSFPLMEAVNRRILLWNEPNCEPAAFDTLKMLLGGDSINAKVKYQSDAVVFRTPIIILTNKAFLPRDPAFSCRVITYHWNTATFLKDYDKKLYPLCLYNIFKVFDIL